MRDIICPICDGHDKTVIYGPKLPADFDEATPPPPDARFAYRLMTAMVEDFPDGPKEIAFLAQRIGELERDRRTLSDGELAHVTRVNADLVAKLVASGKPGVPRQMIALQRELYPS